MKHVKKFTSEFAYNHFITTPNFILPNISLANDTIIYNPYVSEHDYSLDYFTLEFLEAGTFKLKNIYNDAESDEDQDCDDLYAGGIFYSLDNGTTWIKYEMEDTDNDEWPDLYPSINVNANDKVLFKSIRTVWSTDSLYGFKILATADFNACGNIMSLIWGDNFIGQTSFNNGEDEDDWGDNAFANLFVDNIHLINAENLILPATELYGYCYCAMFSGCTNLLTAPILPANELVHGCYQGMFYGCSSLTSITCLATIIPELEDCTREWVTGIASNGTFIKVASMTDWETGDNGIPSGWTVENAN